ncbi:MAG: NUDIX domain-containing protein [Phormidium sp.]
MLSSSGQEWKLRDRFLEIRSRWFTLFGEHLEDSQGQQLEYWRIEKADSVIILPIHNHQIILPPPSYRPGVSQMTLDFPGGRVPEGQTPQEAIPKILRRELGIEVTDIAQLTPLNSQGWAVNSSFSNQKLYGFVANLRDDINLLPEFVTNTYPTTSSGVQNLLKELICLQCRVILLEWWNGALSDRSRDA